MDDRGVRAAFALFCGSAISARAAADLGMPCGYIASGRAIEEARAALEALGDRASGSSCDVMDEGMIAASIIETEERYGPICALICEIDARGEDGRVMLDLDEAEWRDVFDRGPRCFFSACKAALPFLVRAQGSKIVLVVNDVPSPDAVRASAAAAAAAFAGSVEAEVAIHGTQIKVVSRSAGGIEL